MLAITTNDICMKPQEVAATIAQVLVNGTGLAGAESKAIVDAGNQCCSQLTSAIASASSFAQSGGKGDLFSTAASQAAAVAGFTGCAKQAFAAVSTSTTSNQATVSTAAGGNTGNTGTQSEATLRIGPNGQIITSASGNVSG